MLKEMTPEQIRTSIDLNATFIFAEKLSDTLKEILQLGLETLSNREIMLAIPEWEMQGARIKKLDGGFKITIVLGDDRVRYTPDQADDSIRYTPYQADEE